MITGRTEISFLADGLGMAPEEGGGSCVQSNLPIPKINEVYYFEAKLYEKPEPTNVAVGLATKPYPSFRLPGSSFCLSHLLPPSISSDSEHTLTTPHAGWNKHSVGYFSADGFKSYNYPFTATSYGPPLKEGDVLGVGYKPRNGTVFFTRNGRKLEDAYVGFNKHNVFPTIGADGPCMVHVNLGQSGFVFIEANVKKWGLAPSSGTLAPPPAYGSERGSILLETAANGRSESVAAAGSPRISSQPGQSTTTNNNNHNSNNNRRRDRRGSRRHRHARVDHNFAEEGPSSSRLQRTTSSNSSASASSSAASTSQIRIEEEPEDYINTPRSGSRSPADPPTGGDDAQDEDTLRSLHNPHNPPTPNMLDISLHSLRPGSSAGFPQRLASEQGGESENEAEGDNQRPGSPTLQRAFDLVIYAQVQSANAENAGRRSRSPQPGQQRSPSPPAYHVVDPNVRFAPLTTKCRPSSDVPMFADIRPRCRRGHAWRELCRLPSSAGSEQRQPSRLFRLQRAIQRTVREQTRRRWQWRAIVSCSSRCPGPQHHCWPARCTSAASRHRGSAVILLHRIPVLSTHTHTHLHTLSLSHLLFISIAPHHFSFETQMSLYSCILFPLLRKRHGMTETFIVHYHWIVKKKSRREAHKSGLKDEGGNVAP